MSTPSDPENPQAPDPDISDQRDDKRISRARIREQIAQRKAVSKQQLELSNRQHEIALRFKEVIQSHEVAMRNIDLHADYVLSAPRHAFRQRLLLFALIVTVLLITILFFVYCLYTGNREIVMRIIEIIVASLVSGGGGYVIGKNKKDGLPEAVSL